LREDQVPSREASAIYLRGDATEPEKASSGGGDDQQWHGLLARYDLLQAAARLAWEALLEAYKPGADGTINPPAELLDRYAQACAVREVAEMALFNYIESGKLLSND
jgi:hypothetical protein